MKKHNLVTFVLSVTLISWGLFHSVLPAQAQVSEPRDEDPRVAQITTGGDHSCLLTDAGGVRCWGANFAGQVGNDTFDDSSSPVDVIGLTSGIQAVVAGGTHTCVLTNAGGVKCWGWNVRGQLGDGTGNTRTRPVDVMGLTSGVQAIAAGGAHTCALTNAGGVKCWGYNSFGQLGDNSTEIRLRPVDTEGLTSGVQAIAVGGNHTCALTSAGAVKCWGFNLFGQVGDGTMRDPHTPVDVEGLNSDVQAITAGRYHACALTGTNDVMCWGYNSSGQLGDGTTTDQLVPVKVEGLSGDIESITAGGAHTCALTSTGSVQCWGYNAYGQLGDGATVDQLAPVGVAGLNGGVQTVTAGRHHTCALASPEEILCWGSNSYGQLGDGSTTARNTPVATINLFYSVQQSPLYIPALTR